MHKIANALDALTKRLQPRAKTLLHEMMEAPTKADARATLEMFRAKYPKAVDSSTATGGSLTAFYAFAAQHWRHLRTTNPVESNFATAKLRTLVTKAAGSKAAALGMAFKLLRAPKSAGGASTAASSSPTSSPAQHAPT